MTLVDAYVDALDDFVDLECVDRIRGAGTRALYVRTILLANTLVSSPEAKLFLGELGARKVFDSEYKLMQMLSRETLPHSELLGLLEHVYMSQAYGAWFFFAYPARRRLSKGEAERLTRAGIAFRALWLLLDHLVDLDEGRRNSVVTGVRLAIDYAGKPSLVAKLAEKLDSHFRKLLELLEELEGVSYATNLYREYRVLWSRLRRLLEGTRLGAFYSTLQIF